MPSTATHTAYLLASTGTRTTHAIIAGAALPGDFATAACGTYAEAGRTPLDLTPAELEASPTFCKRCAKAIIAAWHQDDLDGYTVTSSTPSTPAACIETIADYALAVEHAAHAAAGDGQLF